MDEMTYASRMNHLAASLDSARMMYALAATHDPSKAALRATVQTLEAQLRAAERAVMTACLDLAECIPEDRGNYTTVRELVLTLRALVHVEEMQS